MTDGCPDEWQTPVLGLLADEIPRGDVGQDAVLERLLDLLLIHAVRAYFARGASQAPGWFRAQDDPVVGHAVRLLQDNPAEAWTLASLARETRVSRATLARRFTQVVGQPPMEYLTEWRLTLAADLILDPAETLGSVAGEVGYGSAYALSAASSASAGSGPAITAAPKHSAPTPPSAAAALPGGDGADDEPSGRRDDSRGAVPSYGEEPAEGTVA